jgi:Phosphotransferase enzyme family
LDITQESNIGAVSSEFQIAGRFLNAQPYGTGHINDTYCLTLQNADARGRIILQRINTNIFKQPIALMENIQRVLTHISARVAADPDRARRVLTLIPARDGQAWHVDSSGYFWRAYRFIENARTFEAVESKEQAFQAGKAFGKFQQMLADLPPPRLHETIRDFHHTPKRFEALQKAVKADVANRAIFVKPEIDFAQARRSIVGVLLGANLPERVTHNDTKFNNVLLDNATGEGICVIDLDTVMPGLVAYDFGDMVRTTTSSSQEDEPDLSKVAMQFPMFEALVRGYLASAGDFLTKAERQYLAFAGKLITFEIGIRFLTDFLAGDTYFKVHRDWHNLERCRTQFRLVESLEHQEDQMNRLVESVG